MLLLVKSELAKAWNRRPVRGLALCAIGLMILFVWANHWLVQDTREAISQLERRRDSLQISNRPSPSLPALTPEQQHEAIESLNQLIKSYRGRLEELSEALGPQNAHRLVLQMLASIPGVSLACLLVSSFVGAEFGWGYWRIMSVQEPRRGKIIFAKAIAVSLLILAGVVIVLILSYPLHFIFARVFHLRAETGTPAATEVFGWIMRAWVSCVTYAAIASAIVIVTKSGLAGAAGTIGFLLLDSFVTGLVPYLRRISPSQQIANLLGERPGVFGLMSRVWPLDPELRIAASGGGLVPTSLGKSFFVLVALTAAMVCVGALAIRRTEL